MWPRSLRVLQTSLMMLICMFKYRHHTLRYWSSNYTVVLGNSFVQASAFPTTTSSSSSAVGQVDIDDERPAKRHRQLPSRFRAMGLKLNDKKLRDILPQPVPALPPPGVDVVAPALPQPPTPSPSCPLVHQPGSTSNTPTTVHSRLRRILETARNSFGLFRRYHAEHLPSHDPEGELDVSALSNIVDSRSGHDPQHIVPSFAPYPNKSSFLLGEWYWNRGSQKSQQDFKELLGIIGDDDFQPASIRQTQWDKVDQKLGLNDWDKEEWIDDDAGWRTSSATISVPFHRLTGNPGVRDYTVINFHHRSLVSVIREKISNSNDNAHFHYEPYELLWQPINQQDGIRVHGELYTSPAFIDAHKSVQELPGEPGCRLPRVVVALMFWSDGTHLTNFGNAKLWPLYMFFGNESKYRRCKPSCNLCEHVAYFETVSKAGPSFAFSLND